MSKERGKKPQVKNEMSLWTWAVSGHFGEDKWLKKIELEKSLKAQESNPFGMEAISPF